MTRKEAITRLKNMAWLYGSAEREQNIEAIDMAIESLQTEVVRCKDCKHYSVKGETTFFGWCGSWNRPTSEMRFCSKGERIKESEVEK